jgi:hypothetical protein
MPGQGSHTTNVPYEPPAGCEVFYSESDDDCPPPVAHPRIASNDGGAPEATCVHVDARAAMLERLVYPPPPQVENLRYFTTRRAQTRLDDPAHRVGALAEGVILLTNSVHGWEGTDQLTLRECISRTQEGRVLLVELNHAPAVQRLYGNTLVMTGEAGGAMTADMLGILSRKPCFPCLARLRGHGNPGCQASHVPGTTQTLCAMPRTPPGPRKPCFPWLARPRHGVVPLPC